MLPASGNGYFPLLYDAPFFDLFGVFLGDLVHGVTVEDTVDANCSPSDSDSPPELDELS